MLSALTHGNPVIRSFGGVPETVPARLILYVPSVILGLFAASIY